MKSYFVLAGNSFTGCHFIDHVLQRGAKVTSISRSPEYAEEFLAYRYRKDVDIKNFTFHQLSVNDDRPAIEELLKKTQPEAVVNFAAQGEVRNSWKWPEQWFETNTIAVVWLGEFLRQQDWLKKYVSVSTPEVYGETSIGMTESHTYMPSTPYAASKLAGDLFLMALHKKYDFPVVYTRAANLYGIHQQLYRIIPRTIIYLKLGRKIQLHGGGKSRRAFIHARDVADATRRAIETGRSGEVYHVAPEGGLISIADLVRKICEMMGYDFEASTEMHAENFGQDEVFSLDASKISNELGWSAQVELEDGIREMIEWVNENWEFLKNQELEYVHKV